MEELNSARSVVLVEHDGHDTLSLVDMGDVISISQCSVGGDFHNVIISLNQAAALAGFLGRVLG